MIKSNFKRNFRNRVKNNIKLNCFQGFYKNFTEKSDNLNKTFKIYTKTGDKGTTGLLGGIRKPKDAEIFDLLGDIDELNSYLGVCCSYLIKTSPDLYTELNLIQTQLYKISSHIASNFNDKYKATIDYETILESAIDKMELELTPLTRFLHPGGTIAASHVHYARTLSRKVERRYISFSKTHNNLIYQKFFNRLSDYLFVSARYINKICEVDDVLF